MVPVTTGPVEVGICFQKTYFTQDGWYPTKFYVSCGNWGWMELHDFMAKKEFAEFEQIGDDEWSVEEYIEIHAIINEKKDLELSHCWGKKHLMYAYNLQQQLKKTNSFLWQFNIVNKDLDGWYRAVVALGSNAERDKYNEPQWKFRKLTLTERFKIAIRQPIVNFLNKLLTPLNKIEHRRYIKNKLKWHKEWEERED